MSVLILKFIPLSAVIFGLLCFILCGCRFVFFSLESIVISLQTAEAVVFPNKLSTSSCTPSVTLQTKILFVFAVYAFIFFTLSFGNYIKPISLVISCRISVYFLPSENLTNKLLDIFYAFLNWSVLDLYGCTNIQNMDNITYAGWLRKISRIIFIVLRPTLLV